MQKNYYIGLDIGTDSVGWAVTDEDYRLIRARGDLWGSYLFDEAQGAADRRAFRIARRRTARTRQRILLLQSLFAEEVAKMDPLFFLRLNNSALFLSDKDRALKTADALFSDADFRDKTYFATYPTVYHLRAALLQGEIRDIRLLYLAIHHIIKNRGHFLFESQSFQAGDSEFVRETFFKINAFLSDRDMPTLALDGLNEGLALLRAGRGSKRDRQKQLALCLKAGKEKSLLALVKAITGGSVSLKELYAANEDFEIKSFSFEKAGFDESDLPAIEVAVGTDEAELVRLLKAVYDWSILCGIMGEERFISLAKVRIYEKHASDLKWLKEYIREHCPAKYADVFRRRAKKNNYAAYIGMDRQKGFAKCKRDEFYAFLKKEVGITDEAVLSQMERGEFLPKQVSNANGVIPYQVHLQELRAILANAEQYFPFLRQEQGGSTVTEKIVALMTFRIPYYVGPLHTQSQFAWAVRRPGYESVSITPWNFQEAIDADASEERFIRRMTNQCTYLVGQDVLPASSLLYSEFTFLNELNNLRVQDVKNDAARRLIYAYAKEHKKVTLKACLALLIRNGLLSADSTTEVFSGLDGDFKTSLAPWYDLRFLGEKVQTHREMCEQIIVWITLISDKSRLERRIREAYGGVLTDEEIKRLKGLNYTKWGRLSAMLLDGIVSPRCADENGELMTIIQAMRTTGENFMQLLSAQYGFQNEIDRYNAENTPGGKVTYQTVDDLYCSPSVKRAIWRTVELVREIEKILGGAPGKVFIEMARDAGDASRKGERTVSRKQQLLTLYRSIRSEERDWAAEIEAVPDLKFNSDKLVLYYRQLGRSMYSGKPIRLEDVFDTNVCDIDHIYPQSKIKDDSLDNRVLVFKTENAVKGDRYPIASEVRSQMAAFWRMLREKELISAKKYDRLMRTAPLTQDELADFINRQLVCTRQSTKAVAEILQKMLPDTEIVYAKAANANAFKDRFGIVKVRELNDLHHAKDAYINIVVGNVYNTKFNHNAAVYFRNHGIESYNIDRLYERDIPGAWKVAEKEQIFRTIAKNTCKVIRMTMDGKGGLFDVNPVPAGKNEGLVPLKQHGAIADTAKYGGYNKASTAYFLLVRSKGKKGKMMLSLEAYPLWRRLQTAGSKEDKLCFCVEQGLIEPEILMDPIKLNTLFCIGGSYAWLRGRTGSRVIWCNANQLFLDEESARYLKKIGNHMRDRKKYNNPELAVRDCITTEENLRLYDRLTEKLDSPVYAGLSLKGQVSFLREKRADFASLSREDQCRVIFEVLHLTQCNSVAADFTLLGGPAHAGIVLSSKFIQDLQIKLIFQSPTGYYRRIVDLKEFL